MVFTRLQSDPQLHFRKLQDDVVIISTHVDDLFIISHDNKHIHATLESLGQTYKLTTRDDFTSHLGLHITHERERGLMTLDQTAFVDTLNNENGFDDCSLRETPMNTNFPEIDTSDRLAPDLHTVHRSKLGSLQFLAALTRPDILFSTNNFSRRALNPTENDMSGVADILRYLRSTRTLGLTFTKGDINLYATADAAFDVYPERL